VRCATRLTRQVRGAEKPLEGTMWRLSDLAKKSTDQNSKHRMQKVKDGLCEGGLFSAKNAEGRRRKT